MPTTTPQDAIAADAKEALRTRALAFGESAARKLFAKRGSHSEIHLRPEELATVLAAAFELSAEMLVKDITTNLRAETARLRDSLWTAHDATRLWGMEQAATAYHDAANLIENGHFQKPLPCCLCGQPAEWATVFVVSETFVRSGAWWCSACKEHQPALVAPSHRWKRIRDAGSDTETSGDPR